MKIIDLEPGDPRLIADLLPVLRELRPHLTPALFEEVYAEGHPQGLRFSACLLYSWRIVAGTCDIRKLYVDDLVTAGDRRSTGVGRSLLAYLEDRAREAGCRLLDLDSGTQRTSAHRFYFRERMGVMAFHFGKELDAGPEPA